MAREANLPHIGENWFRTGPLVNPGKLSLDVVGSSGAKYGLGMAIRTQSTMRDRDQVSRSAGKSFHQCDKVGSDERRCSRMMLSRNEDVLHGHAPPLA